MFRPVLNLAALLAVAVPAQGQCVSNEINECACDCGARFSVFPEVSGARRLPGQWWDDHNHYPVSPPANHAYGIPDHSHKPWSLIPGDGYVGSSPDKTPEADEEEEVEAAEPAAPVTEPPMDSDEPEFGFRKPNTKSSDDAKAEPKEEAEPKEDADDAKKEMRRDMPRRRRPGRRRRPEEEANAAAKDSDVAAATTESQPAATVSEDESADAVVIPADGDDADKAGIPMSLFGVAFLALAFSGHFARKTWSARPAKVPVAKI